MCYIIHPAKKDSILQKRISSTSIELPFIERSVFVKNRNAQNYRKTEGSVENESTMPICKK